MLSFDDKATAAFWASMWGPKSKKAARLNALWNVAFILCGGWGRGWGASGVGDSGGAIPCRLMLITFLIQACSPGHQPPLAMATLLKMEWGYSGLRQALWVGPIP